MLLLTWQKELSGGTQVLGAWAGVVVRNGFSMCLRYWPTSGFCFLLAHLWFLLWPDTPFPGLSHWTAPPARAG